MFGHAVGVQRLDPTPAKIRDSTTIEPKGGHRGLRTAVTLLVSGVLLKLYVVYSAGGLDQTVQRLSGAVRENSGLEQLDADAVGLRNLSGIADGAAVWLLLTALRSKRHRVAASIALALVIILSYTTMGKRLALLWPLLAVAVGMHVFVRRIGIKALPIGVLAFLGLTMGALFFRIFLPAASAGVGIDLNQISYAGGSLLSFYFYSLEFSTVEMITVAIYGRDDLNAIFGGTGGAFFETSIVPFSYIIPRAIWPDKPNTLFDLSHAINAVANGKPLEGTIGYASTLIGTSYIYGGLILLVLVFLAAGFYVAKVDRHFQSAEWSVIRIISYSFFLVVVFHAFRQGTIGWVFIIAVVQQLGFISGFALPLLASGSPRLTTAAGPSWPNHYKDAHELRK
jgi:hypothetical protein